MITQKHIEHHTQGYIIRSVLTNQSLNLELVEWVKVDIKVENEFVGGLFGA